MTAETRPVADHDVEGLVRALVDPENRADPYPIYAQLRAVGVARIPGKPVFLISSFADCESVLRNPTVSAGRSEQTSGSGRANILAAAGADLPSAMRGLPLTMLDPPEHTRQRGLVAKAFTPRVVADLQPAIMALIDDLLDNVQQKGAAGELIDVVSEFALPLPFAVSCQLLGFPAADIAQLSSWSNSLLRSIDPMLSIAGKHPDGSDMAMAVVALHRYAQGVIERRSKEPSSDLITALLAAEYEGAATDRDEVVRASVVLLVSGYETLVNLITNGVLALLRHPEQLEALQAEPTRAAKVVDELLRYDPPVQLIVRSAREKMRVGVHEIEPGATLVMLIAAANRDPIAFESPDAFNPDRSEGRHLGFGLGPHFCLGMALARLEGYLALARFAQRVRRPVLANQPLQYGSGVTIRGLEQLPIRVNNVASRNTPWPDAEPLASSAETAASTRGHCG
jgi:cytochrome P450